MARHLIAATAPGVAATQAPDAEWLSRLTAIPLPGRALSWLAAPDQRVIDTDMAAMAAERLRIVCATDPDYPPYLAETPGAPAALYVAGDATVLRRPAVAIGGALQPTPGGKETARSFGTDLTRAGVGVITGLAEGIESAVQHAVAAAGGGGIAVCAAGLDRIVPAGSARLAELIRQHGCLVSRFAPGTSLQRYHFPLRNRLAAALAAGVLVIEAASGSGVLSLVAQAHRLRRRVFAVPGSIRDPHSHACNQLIRSGAALAEQSGELLEDLDLQPIQRVTITEPDRAATPPLDNKYEMLLDAAGFEPADIDVLALRTGWPAHVIASMLLLLELKGRIALQPGGRYCRLS